MRLLLDSHAFLWFVWSDPRLSPTALSVIGDPLNHLLLGAASAWEIGIKVSTGKLSVGQDVDSFLNAQLAQNRISLLPITVDHIGQASRLPFHNKDPFDRLIVAQALVEGCPVISADAIFDAYGAQRIW